MARRGLEVDVELPAHHCAERLGLGERVPRAAIACRQGQYEPLPVLAHRIERQQPLGRRDCLLAVAHQVRVRGERLAQPGRRQLGAGALRAGPLDETVLLDIQAGEEVPAEPFGGTLQVARVEGLREGFELARIDRPGRPSAARCQGRR